MNKFNLKYLVIATVLISALLVVGALIFSSFNKAKPIPGRQSTTQQATFSAALPAIQAPTVSSFSAVVQEIKNGKLLVETQDKKPQIIEIPLDKNASLEIWVSKDGKDKPPTRQKATSADLKVGQNLDIFKTEVSNRQPIYEITILNN